MTTKEDKQQEDINNIEKTMENQSSNRNLRCAKDLDKLGDLKSPPRSQIWFQKQFRARKNTVVQLDDAGANPRAVSTASSERRRRLSSSLPDLSTMLDAAMYCNNDGTANDSRTGNDSGPWSPGALKPAKSRKRSRMPGTDSFWSLAL